MSKEMLELLLCPFCGSPGAICCIEDEPDSPCSFWVSCSCGIETRERRTEAEAIALWNTRASAVAEPVAPEAAPTREEIARIIYDAFPFEPSGNVPNKPAWVAAGNAMRQDEARRAADAIIALKSAPAK